MTLSIKKSLHSALLVKKKTVIRYVKNDMDRNILFVVNRIENPRIFFLMIFETLFIQNIILTKRKIWFLYSNDMNFPD